MADATDINIEDIDGEEAAAGRQRSKVAFPYFDLKASLAIANAIHDKVGNGQCSLQQISAWLDQSIKSSGFRIQISAARLFGVIESDGTESYRLTPLGRRIVDPQTTRKAKAEAFLNVPLFRVLYESHKEGVLPPSTALEAEIVGVGVAEKQKERARQLFDRSAEQAGFFEHGRNRLVMPAVAVKAGEPTAENGTRANKEEEGSQGPRDPLIAALIQKLPASGKDWPVEDRIMWLQMISMAFQMAYGQADTIEIRRQQQ